MLHFIHPYAGDSYGTELVKRVESDYPPFRLSDTVLYKALKFLDKEESSQDIGKKLKDADGLDACTKFVLKCKKKQLL